MFVFLLNKYFNLIVAELVERQLPTPEIHSLNPIIGKILSTNLSNKAIIEKTKVKKKRPGMAYLFKVFQLKKTT